MAPRTQRTKDLERFKEQLFRWHFIDECSIKEVKRRFDLLFAVLAKLEGKLYSAKLVYINVPTFIHLLTSSRKSVRMSGKVASERGENTGME